MSAAALSPKLDAALSQIERQLEAISTAAGYDGGDPVALEALGGVLRQLVLDFAGLVEGQPQAFASAQSQQRLKKIAQSLSSQREGMIRRSASVERALNALMPATDANAVTYVPSTAPAYGPGRRRYEV